MSPANAASGSFEDLPETEPYAGIFRRRFDSSRATVARYRFEPGARFPLHRHPEEQLTLIEEGDVTFTVDGIREALGPGGWAIVAPNEAHELVAGPQGARITAIIVPRRQGTIGYEVVDAD